MSEVKDVSDDLADAVRRLRSLELSKRDREMSNGYHYVSGEHASYIASMDELRALIKQLEARK